MARTEKKLSINHSQIKDRDMKLVIAGHVDHGKSTIIGPATEKVLNNRGIYSELVPENNTTDALGELFISKVNKPKSILLPGSAIARKKIDEVLLAAGHQVDKVSIY